MTMNAQETTKLIQSMFAAEGSGGYTDFAGVVCPYCPEQPTFCHLERPDYFSADNYEATRIYQNGAKYPLLQLWGCKRRRTTRPRTRCP